MVVCGDAVGCDIPCGLMFGCGGRGAGGELLAV
jgi:hypothetical protein